MIGIDTNILIRYIIQDDPIQSRLATKFLESNINKANPGFISQIVLCEIVWVLRRAYGYDKPIILQVLNQIIDTSEFIIENSESARQALRDFKEGNADFSDYLIGSANKYHGCEYTLTLDKKAAIHPNFRLCK